MIRLLLLLLALSAAVSANPARAQKPAPPVSAISNEQARAALDVLNDPKKRAAFTATLEAIVHAQASQPDPAPGASATPVAPGTETPLTRATAVEGLSIPLAPDSLGAQVLVTGSEFVNRAGNQTMAALRAVQSVPLLWGWTVVMATNPLARNLLEDAAWRLAIALACAMAVEYALRRSLRRPIAGLEAIAPPNGTPPASAPVDHVPADGEPVLPSGDGVERAEAGEIEAPLQIRRRPSAWTLLRRVPLVLARLLLELLPVLGLMVTGHLIAGSSIGGHTVSRLVILAVIDAYSLCAAVLCVARMLLSPSTSRLRLLHLPDATATYLMRWVRRLVLLAVFGYAVGEVGLLLGLSDLAHDAVQKMVGLTIQICLALMVVQKQRAIRHWLRAPRGATGIAATLRNRIAAIWHWIALFLLATAWLVWAIEVPHGYAKVLHWSIVTALILIGARLLQLLLLGVVDRAVRVGPETSSLYPGLEVRLQRYHPAASALLRLLVTVLTVLALLQLYGLGAFAWLVGTPLGQRILSSLATLGMTILLALVAWEAVNAAFQRHLAKLQREAQVARSARLRTLLPLLRTTLLITIVVVAGLMVLSEIGINIAPLLAGAGIVGVAIGFGSQKLVQDLITGIFLLLENAMQVGDWVTVSGLSGSVEALSVRTIRLRAGDGSVHIIPFSAVTSVTNVNRGLGNASINVTVEYDEDTDRVADLLREIVANMRAEPDFSAKMLSDLQLWGVDKVDGAGVTLAGQVVCTDSGRWSVQREFNRRMKMRFQELGVRIYNPMRTIAMMPQPVRPAEEEAGDGQARAAD